MPSPASSPPNSELVRTTVQLAVQFALDEVSVNIYSVDVVQAAVQMALELHASQTGQSTAALAAELVRSVLGGSVPSSRNSTPPPPPLSPPPLESHDDELLRARDALAVEVATAVIAAAFVTSCHHPATALPPEDPIADSAEAVKLARRVVKRALSALVTSSSSGSSSGDDDAREMVAGETLQSVMERLQPVLLREAAATVVQRALLAVASCQQADVRAGLELTLRVLAADVVMRSTSLALQARRDAVGLIADRAWPGIVSRAAFRARAVLVIQRYSMYHAAVATAAEKILARQSRRNAAATLVQSFCRALDSYTLMRVLRTKCYYALQRVSRGLQARRRLGRLMHGIPAMQALLRSRDSQQRKWAQHWRHLDACVVTTQAALQSLSSVLRTTAKLREKRTRSLVAIQSACRTKHISLLVARLVRLQVASLPVKGANRVLQRLLGFMPSEEGWAQQRRETLLRDSEGRRSRLQLSDCRHVSPSLKGASRSSTPQLEHQRRGRPASPPRSHTSLGSAPLDQSVAPVVGYRHKKTKPPSGSASRAVAAAGSAPPASPLDYAYAAARPSSKNQHNVSKSSDHSTRRAHHNASGRRSPSPTRVERESQVKHTASNSSATATPIFHGAMKDYSGAMRVMAQLVRASGTAGTRHYAAVMTPIDASGVLPGAPTVHPGRLSPLGVVKVAMEIAEQSGQHGKSRKTWH